MVDRDKFRSEHCGDVGPAGDVSLDKDEDDEDLANLGPRKGSDAAQVKPGGKSGDPRLGADAASEKGLAEKDSACGHSEC